MSGMLQFLQQQRATPPPAPPMASNLQQSSLLTSPQGMTPFQRWIIAQQQQRQQQAAIHPQTFRDALYNMWQRFHSGQPPQPPQPAAAPAAHHPAGAQWTQFSPMPAATPTTGPMPGAMYNGPWNKLDASQQNYVNANALDRPPPASGGGPLGGLHPSSLRIDFHPPESPQAPQSSQQ